MQKLVIAIMALLLVVIGNFSLQAQSIHFQNTDGTKISYNLEDVRKITMENNKVQVHMKDGNLYERDMAALQNYRYNVSTYITAVDIVLSEGNKTGLLVYPNPTKNLLHLTYTLSQVEEIKCVIVDMQGRKVSEVNLGKQAAGEQQESISLKDLPAGTYTVQIQGQNFSIHKQIVNQ